VSRTTSQGHFKDTLKDWFKKEKSFDEEYKAFSMEKNHLKINFEGQRSPTHYQGVPTLLTLLWGSVLALCAPFWGSAGIF
jgi:ferritin-like metal-binding protein YciE